MALLATLDHKVLRDLRAMWASMVVLVLRDTVVAVVYKVTLAVRDSQEVWDTLAVQVSKATQEVVVLLVVQD